MSTRRRLAVSLVAAAAAAGAVPLLVGSPAASLPAPAQCPSTPSFDYTMVTPVGPPAVVDLGAPVSGYAALGGDKKLYYHGELYSVDPLETTELACLGGQATDAPAVIANSETGGVTFFVRAANGRIYYRSTSSTLPSGGDPEYSSLGAFTAITNVNFTAGVGAVQTPDGVLHIFGRGTNGALYHAFRQDNPNTWRVENLGGSITGQPVVTVDGSQVLVAATTPGGAIYTKRGTSFAFGPYIKIMAGRTVNGPLFTTASSPALARNAATGQITLYAVSSQKGLYRLTKAPGVAFPTTPWERVDTVLPADARIAAVENGDLTQSPTPPGEGAGNAIVYATWLDRTTTRVVAAYTQFLDGAWRDYRLVPYSCFNCAPDGGFSTTSERTKKGSAKVRVQDAPSAKALESQKG
jgi:hypothetical protein